MFYSTPPPILVNYDGVRETANYFRDSGYKLLRSEQNPEECDATGDASSTTARPIKTTLPQSDF
ncbi:MAG: hypothetical protein ABI675_20595 [Chitinophagaceae bacterium]